MTVKEIQAIFDTIDEDAEVFRDCLLHDGVYNPVEVKKITVVYGVVGNPTTVIIK